MTVLVAARDEAVVLPQLVADLAAQDHRDTSGRPCFELIVVDDRSRDGSGDAVRDAAERHGIADLTAIIDRRGDVPDGKGAALTAAPPEICRGEVIAVLDADARIAPDFLRRAASYFSRGEGAMTARRRVVTEGEQGWRHRLAQAQDDEQTADGELQRGRWASGGASEFRGNGILVRTDLLARAGGWRAEALCEDLDLATRIGASSGVSVGWALDVVVSEEPIVDPRALWRQRCRWAEGIVRRELDLTPVLLSSRRLTNRAKLDYLAYSSQTLLPLTMIGTLIGGFLFRRLSVAAGLLSVYLGAGTVLSVDSLRWSGLPMASRLPRAVRVTLFSVHWLAVFPVGWLRVALGRSVRYQKMEHRGMGTP